MYKGTELQDEPVDKCNAVGPVSPTPTTPTASDLNVASWPSKPPATDTGGGGGGRGGGKENLGAEEALTSLPGADPLRDAAAAARNRKFPLQRKQSNLTSDSGRSSTSAVAGENLDSVFQNDVDIVRRHSLNCVDSTGHLNVPGGPSSSTSSSPTGDAGAGDGVGGGVALEQQQQPQLRTSASYTALSSSSSSSSSPSSPSSKTPAVATAAAAGDKPTLAGVSVKRAPKIVYSHSEDRLLTQGLNQRPIIPALPYSPTASPRLRRQPTMETHRVSVSDGDGFTQLNQYRLKDEIGKVSVRGVSLGGLAGLIAALSGFWGLVCVRSHTCQTC